MSIFKTLLFIWLAIFASASCGEELTAQKQAGIEKLLVMTGAFDLGKQMSEATVKQMTEMLRKNRPDIPEKVLNVLPQEVNAVINENLDDFKALVIPLYHKHFTADDIKGMIQFYSTPLGKKTIQVMPQLARESMQLGMQWGRSIAPEVNNRVKARLSQEGYKL